MLSSRKKRIGFGSLKHGGKYQSALMSLLLITTLAGCGVFPRRSDAASDDKVTAAVQARLVEHPDLETPNLLTVQTINHVVYLGGIVSTSFQLQEAEEVAGQTTGVSKVVTTVGLSK